MGQQSLAIARSRAPQRQKAHTRRWQEDIEGDPHACKTGNPGRGDEPAREPQKRRPHHQNGDR